MTQPSLQTPTVVRGASSPNGPNGQHRQKLTRPINQQPSQPSQPGQPSRAVVVAPNTPQLDPTSVDWRWRCVELARRSGRQADAVYLGRSTQGVDTYAVESRRHAGLRYIILTQSVGTAHGVIHHWRCQCPQGAQRKPCAHVGAAFILSRFRDEVLDAMAAAIQARMTIAQVQHRIGSASGALLFYVALSARRNWDTVEVTWDPRPGREVAVNCACGEIACPHIGVVALRREHDKRQQERMRQFGYCGGTPWDRSLSSALSERGYEETWR